MRPLLLLTLLVAAPIVWGQDPVALKRTAAEGESAKYKLAVETEISGMKIKFTANVVEKVTKVSADGSYSVSSEQQDATLEVNGESQPAPGEIGAQVTTVFRADGSISDVSGDNVGKDTLRLSNIQSLLWPKETVKVGSKWQGQIQGDKNKETVDVVSNYEVVGREKVGNRDCFKLTFDSKEQSGSDPASTKGTLWVDVASGLMVKNESDWMNMPIAGQMINGKVVLSLVE